MSAEISNRIPILNFVMLCCIIFYHCQMPWPGPTPVRESDEILNWVVEQSATNFAELGMATFFTTSGFLLFYGLTFKTYKEKMKRRFFSLFIPYMVWQLIYTGKGLLQGQTWSLQEWVGDVFFFQFWPPLGAFWYIYTLLALALISPLFLLLLRNRKTGWMIVLLSLVLFFCMYKNWNRILNDERLGYLKNIVMYFPSYLIGAFYGFHYQGGNEEGKQLSNILSAFLLVLVLEGWLPGLTKNTVIQVLPIVLLYLLPVEDWMKNRNIYHISFLMYATHQSIISLCLDSIREPISNMVSSIWIANLGGRVLCTLVIVIINYALYWGLVKYMPSVLRLLTGGRAGRVKA